MCLRNVILIAKTIPTQSAKVTKRNIVYCIYLGKWKLQVWRYESSPVVLNGALLFYWENGTDHR